MAELEGLGETIGEESGPEEAPGRLGGADAVAVAVALDAARHDPALSRATREYLDRQRRLVELQIHHFDEEHRLAIAATRRRALIDRLRIGLQVLVALIGAAIVVGVAALVWSASHDHGVVIDAVSVPGDLAQRGYTGEAIAKRILDRLAELNRLSTTVRAANSYANSLDGDLKIEIPETGVSIGELSRVLHEWLGHATHVDGEITHTGDDVSVRIRIGDQYTVQSTGPAANLEALVQDAATKIYAKTQAYRYGYWLMLQGDGAGAGAVFRQLAIAGPRSERIWALHGLALLGGMRAAVPIDRQVLEIDPNFYLGRLTLADEYLTTGQDELALKEARVVIAGEHGTADATLSRRGEAEVRARAQEAAAEMLGDYLGVVTSAEAIAAVSDGDERVAGAWRIRIYGLLGLHDVVAAANALALMPTTADSWAAGQWGYQRAKYFAERGDWAAVATQAEQANAAFEKEQSAYDRNPPLALSSLLAVAYAHLGRGADADRVLASIPADAYDGWCARGEVAVMRKDYPTAGKAFAEAVRQGPSIPRAYLEWGEALAASGDLPGALGKYAEANRRGPQWADPLKFWGDALLRQGHSREALSKYNAALKRAPNWVELQAARDHAAAVTTSATASHPPSGSFPGIRTAAARPVSPAAA